MQTLTLLKFWAPWCAPCKAMSPVVEKVISEFNNVELKNINIDEESDLAIQYMVRSIPTLIAIKNSEKVGSLVGFRSAQELRDFLSSHS